MGAARGRAPTTDATATRVLTKGEPIGAASGRADDFAWPRGSQPQPSAEPVAAEPAAAPATATAPPPAAKGKAAAPAQQKAATDAQGAQGNTGDAANPPAPPKQAQRRPHNDVPRPPAFIRNFFRYP
jgi:hypothetical protein